MKKAIIVSLVVIVAAVLASQFLANPLAKVDKQYDAAESPIFQTTLDNGLEVTVKEMHALPLVTIQFWVHVGSKNEEKSKEGVSHIFEHMWFKGTDTQPVGSFHKRVENMGGEHNAMTSQDWTMFYVVVPSDEFDAIFPYMVDLFKNPKLEQEEIDKELQVILEEQRMSYNDPIRFVDDKFVEILVDEHPYRVPIIGYKESISNMKREDILDVYNTYYVPNNMNIVIVGDVDTATVVEKIEDALGDLKPEPLPELDLPEQNILTIPRYNSSERELGSTYIALGYVTPESTSKDHYALQVLNVLMSELDSSILKKMEKERNLIQEGMSVSAQLNDFGVFEIVIVVEPEKREDAVAALLAEINKLKTRPLDPEQLQRAKTYLITENAKKNEEVFEVGMEIGEAWIDKTLPELENYDKNIQAVTAEDIQEVANKYFKAFAMYEVKPK
ncbi:insulinase family protein [Candidatus Woesearchaeota archaeon]|nr:insulinase family protein [Candidatus Woesearchaeota archaeon]